MRTQYCVYVINQLKTKFYKIGLSTDGDGVRFVDDAVGVEQHFHKIFAAKCILNEWYKLTILDLRKMDRLVNRHGDRIVWSGELEMTL